VPQFSSVRASELTIPFRLQRRVETVSASGEVLVAWKTYCSGWAKEMVMTPREFVAAETVLSEARRVFLTYWVPNIKPSDRLVTGDGRTYDVVQAVKPDGYDAAVMIYCVDMQNAD